MFHKVAWQHTQGVVGFLMTNLLQIYRGIFLLKISKIGQFDRMATSLWPDFLAHPVGREQSGSVGGGIHEIG